MTLNVTVENEFCKIFFGFFYAYSYTTYNPKINDFLDR